MSNENNKIEFEKLIIDFNLDKNFDVNWLINLIPCHSICNARKSDILFSKSTTLYYFEISRTRIARVESEKAKLNTNKQRDTVLLNIEKALETIKEKDLKISRMQDALTKKDSVTLALVTSLKSSVGISDPVCARHQSTATAGKLSREESQTKQHNSYPFHLL